MAYVVPIHRPGSVRHALKLNFLEPDRQCLIVAKANRLEIYDPTAEGLVLRYTRALYGKVTMLDKLRPANAATDHLFIGTDRHYYFTVSWDAASQQLKTEKAMVDQADTVGRDSQSHDRCAIDPSESVLTMELFEGTLTVVPLVQDSSRKRPAGDVGSLTDPINVRIPELFIRSWAWLHPRAPVGGKRGPKGPRLALLFDDSHGAVRLRVKELEHKAGFDHAEFADLEKPPQEEVDPSASHVVPVPGPVYGLLVLAETRVTYVDELTTATHRQPLDEPAIWAAWAPVPDGKRWLLGDDYGRLYFLMLLTDDAAQVEGFRIDFLGTTSRASVITYIDDGYFFIGSHSADSQVIRVREKSIEVIQTISNIAPILDFTVMDMGNRSDESQTNEYSSGQARIVTGSGAFQDGSLRSVRSGVGIEELGSLGEMPNVTEIFPLKSYPDEAWDDVLMVSFLTETRVFRFSADGEIEELSTLLGFELSEPTILAKNISDGRVVQVTSSTVRLIDVEGDMVTATWSSDTGAKIVAASTNGQKVAVSLAGIELIVLDLSSDLRVLGRRKSGEAQISCVDLPTVQPDICFVGYWNLAGVAILRADSLTESQYTKVSDDPAAVPRSVLVTQILPHRAPTLFVALADGNVVTFDVQSSGPNVALENRKSTILGTQQANLKALPRENGLSNVFATCEHPSLIYHAEGRIVYSAVTVEKASYVCSFNAEAYPGAIAVATAEDLKLALVDEERTTHVQKLHVGETVRRIAYSPKLKAFAMGTIGRRLRKGAEIVQSYVKLADEVVFKELDTHELREDELVESVIRADVVDQLQGAAERFVVGTSYMADDESETPRGRILVFEVTQDRKLELVTELPVRGACRALAVLDGLIVAALVKTVVIYALVNGELQKSAAFRTSTMPIDISVSRDGLIAIADVMKSVSIVRYAPASSSGGGRGKLDEVARHFHVAWSTAVAPVADDTWRAADAEGNLTVLRRNAAGVTADDRRRLETTSEIRLGEMVNRIRPVNVPASPAAVVLPRAFMATTDGSIYLFALIQSDRQDLLMRLQGNMAKVVQSSGHVPFAKYRALKTGVREAAESERFVDGELIEKFLECDDKLQQDIVADLNVEAADVRAMVESLRRVH